MALEISLVDFTAGNPDLDLVTSKKFANFGQISLKFEQKSRFYYELTCSQSESAKSTLQLRLHCQDLETLEIQENCVNSKPVDAPFTCNQIDTFMFGKILRAANTENSTVLDTWTSGFVDSPAIVYGQPDPKQVEENWKKELQTLGAPQMLGIFNFDSQSYSNSLRLKNNGPEMVHNSLELTPYCLPAEQDLASSGIEQLDTIDPNYMAFENHKTRYSLDLRDTLTSLKSGENNEIPTQTEAVMIFGWAETYKDMNFLKNKPFSGQIKASFFIR